MYKNAAPISWKTRRFSITKVNPLIRFRQMIDVCSEDHTKHINQGVVKRQRA